MQSLLENGPCLPEIDNHCRSSYQRDLPDPGLGAGSGHPSHDGARDICDECTFSFHISSVLLSYLILL